MNSCSSLCIWHYDDVADTTTAAAADEKQVERGNVKWDNNK